MLSGVAIGTPPCRLLVKHVSLVASATLVQPAYRGLGKTLSTAWWTPQQLLFACQQCLRTAEVKP